MVCGGQMPVHVHELPCLFGVLPLAEHSGEPNIHSAFSGRGLRERMLSKSMILCAVVLAGAFVAFGPAANRVSAAEISANEHATRCLTPAQRRYVAASCKVVPLSKAIRAARARRIDVVDAKLCKSPKGLVYLLTLLAHDGKVTRVAVDAASGKLSDGG
jgi:hypothetical protein